MFAEHYFLISKTLFILIDIFGIWIAFWVYFTDQKRKENRYFFLMTFFILVWITFGYLAHVEKEYNLSLIWTKIAATSALLFLTAAFFFVIHFVKKEEMPKIIGMIILSLGAVFVGITLFTNWFFEGMNVTEWGFLPRPGEMWGAYNGFAFFMGILIFFIALKKYFKLLEREKLKMQYFLIGFLIFIIMNILFNTILPVYYQTYHLYQFGNYSAIFFLSFTAYAIVKREFFGIKVVLTNFFVGLIAILFALDIFVFTAELMFQLYKGLVLVFFLYFGYLLIMSVLREIEMREKVKRAYDIEKKVREQIEELTEAKTQFIMATQHHLRTPLTSMIGYLDLLFGGTYGKVPVKIKQALLKFESSTKRLIRVVDELLDISQFQLGKEVVSLEPGTDVLPILKEVIEELQFEVEYRGLYLKLEKPALRGPQGKLPKIKADSEKLKVALFNIVDNAIKYTRKGGVIVNVKSQMSNVKRKQGSLLITIKDTGIGIAKGEAGKLFKEAFERGKTAKKVHGFGRGIGLFVTGHIIRAHHGKIWAESEGEGKGSTFFIELPID